MPGAPDLPSAPRRSAHDPLRPTPSRAAAIAREGMPWLYFVAFLVGTALVVAAVWHHVDTERQSNLALWRTRIGTIADDRVQLVENWLGARRADAEVLAASPTLRAALAAPRAGESGLSAELDRIAASHGYASIRVTGADGQLRARSSDAEAGSAPSAEIASVLDGLGPDIDLVGDAAGGPRTLSISVPILADVPAGPRTAGRRPLGVLTVRMRPEAGLFPLLVEDAVSPRTGETLLFEIGRGEATYLSPFRHTGPTSEAVRRSLDAIRGFVETAAPSRVTSAELIDYRSTPVLAAVRLIGPPAAWGLLFKVDREEVLADLNRATLLAATAAAFLLLALAGLLAGLWRQRQRAALVRAQIEQERAILDLEGYAGTIVDNVPSGLLLLDPDLRVLSVNAAFLESFQLSHADVLGRELGHVMRAEALVLRAREVLAAGVAERDLLFNLRGRLRQESRPALVTMTPIRTAGSAENRLLLIIQDLTEEERLRAARQTSEQRFRDLVEGLDAIVWEADASTLRFSFVSRRAEAILGHPVERWLSSPDFFETRVHPDDRPRVVGAWRDAIARGADHEIEYRALAADGREVWLRDIVHVRCGPSGRAVQLRGVSVDLTARRRAEEALKQVEGQLRQAQKMDAVGKLAGGIAHDFNNQLMVIRGGSDLLLRRLPDGDPLRRHAEGIRDAADQAATLTRQLLAVSRKQVLAPAVLDVNQIVVGLSVMLERLLGEAVDLVTVTAPDLGRIKADPGQIEQMMLNLAVNARDAMPGGGRLFIQTANATVTPEEAARAGGAPGAYVMLEVKDTGVGMDREVQSHLFEPFFTTKGHGKGTGLGLSTVYGIVSQSGGHIRVESEPGKGTTFRVYLPRVEDAAPLAAAPRGVEAAGEKRDERATGASRERILLVEDAARVRAVVREILEMHGYDVIEAQSGADALALAERHTGPIALMVTDVVMPEMSGLELAERLRPRRPDMRVLYMSGYADDAIVRLGADAALLAKPFPPDALAAKVREILDAPRPEPQEDTR